MFDISTKAKPSGVRRLKVNDRTTRVLKTGKTIPTWSKMVQEASKI